MQKNIIGITYIYFTFGKSYDKIIFEVINTVNENQFNFKRSLEYEHQNI